MNHKLISMDLIDYDDEYKFSRPYSVSAERLVPSIAVSGIIEPLLLTECGGRYRIICGHNRLKSYLDMSGENVPAVIIDEVSDEIIMNVLYLKNYHGQLGPVGKLKAVKILKKRHVEKFKSSEFFRSTLNIPEEFLDDISIDKFFSLDNSFLNYFDKKDINFKIIKKVLNLSVQSLGILNNWILVLNMRVNYFNRIVDMVYEIEKTKPDVASLKRIELTEGNDADKILFETVYSIRYPEYSGLMKKSTDVKRKYSNVGIDVVFPDYFEGDRIQINLQLSKKDGGRKFLKSVDLLSDMDTEELLEFI